MFFKSQNWMLILLLVFKSLSEIGKPLNMRRNYFTYNQIISIYNEKTMIQMSCLIFLESSNKINNCCECDKMDRAGQVIPCKSGKCVQEEYGRYRICYRFRASQLKF